MSTAFDSICYRLLFCCRKHLATLRAGRGTVRLSSVEYHNGASGCRGQWMMMMNYLPNCKVANICPHCERVCVCVCGVCVCEIGRAHV